MDRRIRWGILGFCCALFLALAPAVVMYSLGYRLRGGHLEETGLVLLESTPSAAEVWVDGKPTGKKTPTEISLSAPGQYAVALRLGEHRLWHKQLAIRPQKVTRAEKIVLVPEKIESMSVGTHSVSTFALTGDGKALVIADTESPPNLWM